MNGKRWKENAKDITILEKPVLRCGSESPRKLLIPYCPVRPHLYIILAFLLRSTHNAWLAPAGFRERNLISDTHHLTFTRRSCLSFTEDVAFDINIALSYLSSLASKCDPRGDGQPTRLWRARILLLLLLGARNSPIWVPFGLEDGRVLRSGE